MKFISSMLIAISAVLLAYGCAPESTPIPIEQCDAVTYSPTAPAAAPLVVNGQQFKDDSGRTILLRGINTAGNSKMPDFMPIDNEALLDPLVGWGFNTLRLLFTWEAFEGTRCSFDSAYMDYYEQVVQWAAARNMYVIVDFHQDAYSRFALGGCGEGFPSWSMSSAIAKDTPDNGANCADWGIKMTFDYNNGVLWDHFHTDREGARTAFLDMVEEVAHTLSTHPNVIGYDIVNEPWGSDQQILNLFELATTRIRQHHPEAIIFVSSHALVSGGAADNLPKPSFSNFAYSPHYYDPNVFIFKEYQGNDMAVPLDNLRQKALTWNVPMFLGEFGAPEETVDGGNYVNAIYDWFDNRFVSGAQWSYTPDWNAIDKDGWNVEDLSIVNGAGQLRSNFAPRPYPKATAGNPIDFTLDADGFSYQWDNVALTGNTEIFIPLGYNTGKTLTATETGCSIIAQTVLCQVTSDGPVTVSLITTP